MMMLTTVRNHDILRKPATNSMADHQILISHKATIRMEASGMNWHVYLLILFLLIMYKYLALK